MLRPPDPQWAARCDAGSAALGAELSLDALELGDEGATARLVVPAPLSDADGAALEAMLAALAVRLPTAAARPALAPGPERSVVLSTQTSFLRPVTGEHVQAVATRRHRGRTTWLWEVEAFDDQGRLCAFSRVTLALRQAP